MRGRRFFFVRSLRCQKDVVASESTRQKRRLLRLPFEQLEPRLAFAVDLPHSHSPVDPLLVRYANALPEVSVSPLLMYNRLGHVAVTITAADVDALLPELERLGYDELESAPEIHLTEGYLPQASVLAMESLVDEGLLGVSPIFKPITHAGSALSQADITLESNRVRGTAPGNFDGTGIKVGVLSDSYNNLGGAAADVTSGDLPATVEVQADAGSGGTDEGRAMMQLVHDIAPGASLAFATAFNGELDFARQIRDLANGGADVIVDDISYFFAPMFQDGAVAQAVTDVVTNSQVAYFSSAGNMARQSYETTSVSFEPDSAGLFSGVFLDFDPGPAVDTRQTFVLQAGDSVLPILQWDDPYFTTTGVDTDLDIFLVLEGTTTLAQAGASGSASNNLASQRPAEGFLYTNNSGAVQNVELIIKKSGGPNPGRLKYIDYRGDAAPAEFATNSSTIAGHAAAALASSVGASFFGDQRSVEGFSSAGPSTILFSPSGVPLASAEVRQTPRITATDGTDTTFFGQTISDGTAFPNFFGTSAAAPHAAAVAALMLDANPSLTPAEVYARLESTATDLGVAGYDNLAGHGLINAYDAIFGPATAVPIDFTEGFEAPVLSGHWETSSTGPGRILVTSENGPAVGAQHLTMDTFASFAQGLNEATLHVNATGHTNVVLNFQMREFSDESHSMPATFTGSTNADGLALSVDGINWFRLLDLTEEAGNQPNTYTNLGPLNLSTFAASNGLTLGSDVRIRFQQFDNSPILFNDGFAFDDIRVTADPVAPANLELVASTSDQAEGNTGTTPFEFTVNRTGNLGVAVTVNYAVTATGTNAASAQDFTGNTFPSGTVSFAAGETSKTISIPVSGDVTVEADEDFTVTLSGAAGAATITNASVPGVIRNDDSAFTITANVNAPTLPTGAVGYWSGNHNALDHVGTNHGALSGLTSYASGILGEAFSFNGFPDDVRIPAASNLDITESGFSASFWVRGTTNQDGSIAGVLDKSHGYSFGTTGWTFQALSSSGVIGFAIGDGAGFPEVHSSVSVLDDTFHHVVGTWDPTDDRMSLYVDGILMGTTLNPTPANNVGALVIGRTDGTPNERSFRGAVDEVQIFNRALTLGEIQSMHSLSGTGGGPAGHAPEGDSGETSMYFTVSRLGAATGAASVQYTSSPFGASPASTDDFTGSAFPSETLTFAPGETTKLIRVAINGDTSFELDEEYEVALSGATGVSGILTDTAIGRIVNDDPPNTLHIANVSLDSSGATVEFSRALDIATFNLYDGSAGLLGAPDLTLVGSTVGNVRGSVAMSADGKSARFIKSGGPLAADTYTLTVRSGASGAVDASANQLDGDSNGVAGDDFTQVLSVAAIANGVTLMLPDFARGFGQEVNLPLVSNAGFPVKISTGVDVTRVGFDLTFDPQLLSITDFSTAIAGATSTFTELSSGNVRVSVVKATPFTTLSGEIELGRFIARVPDTAPYAHKNVLAMSNLSVLDGASLQRAGIADHGIHVTAFAGDANASRNYTSGDTTLLQRQIVGLGTGFVSYQLADPFIISDMNQSGGLNSGDTTILQRLIVGTSVTQVPPIPTGVTPTPVTGADPILSIPSDLTAALGGAFLVPIRLDVTDPFGITLSGIDLAIAYDRDRLRPVNVHAGLGLADTFGLNLNTSIPGIINVSMTSSTGLAFDVGTILTLLQIEFVVLDDAQAGKSAINLLANSASTWTVLTDRELNELLLSPAPTNADDDAVDGSVTIG